MIERVVRWGGGEVGRWGSREVGKWGGFLLIKSYFSCLKKPSHHPPGNRRAARQALFPDPVFPVP